MRKFDFTDGAQSTQPIQVSKSVIESLPYTVSYFESISEMLDAVVRQRYQNVLSNDDPRARLIGFRCWNMIENGKGGFKEKMRDFVAPLTEFTAFKRQYPLVDLTNAKSRQILALFLRNKEFSSFQQLYTNIYCVKLYGVIIP